MATRPTVSVASAEGERLKETIPLPSVFTAPIRPDIVQYVPPFEDYSNGSPAAERYTQAWLKTRDNLTPSVRKLVTKPQPSRGEQVSRKVV